MGLTGRKRYFCGEKCKLYFTNHIRNFNAEECLKDCSLVDTEEDLRNWARKWCLDKKGAFRRKVLEELFYTATGIGSIVIYLKECIDDHPSNIHLTRYSEKFNAWLNNSSREMCPICERKYPSFNQTIWRKYCSEKCCNAAKRSGGGIRQTMDETFIEKYGVKGGFTKERLKQFSDEYEKIHGVRNSMQLPTTIQKSMLTRKENGFDKISKPELEIKEFIESLNLRCEHSNWSILKGKQLDLYIPEKKVAIEYNGCFFHSEGNGGLEFAKSRHVYKTEECEKQNIHLIHIWEDEWENGKQKVLNMIRAKLGKTEEKIYARKTLIVENVSPNNLYNKVHIQGNGSGSLVYGLIYEGELVASMSFIKRPQDGVWELNRYASLNVVGGFSKLLRHFQRNNNYNSIISFGDRCVVYRNSNVYLKNGFEEIAINKPDYKYTNGQRNRIHKFNFRKSILSKKHGFDLSMTEYEMAHELGFKRIYNSGLIKYELKKAL